MLKRLDVHYSSFLKIIILLPIVLFILCVPSVAPNADKTPAVNAYLTDNRFLSEPSFSDSDNPQEKVNKVVKPPEPKEAIIVIDPGHGGSDWGTYYGDLYEKNVNLDISLRLGRILQKSSIKIEYTRVKDVDVGLRERAEFANNMDAALFISIHHNRMPNNSSYRGTETLFCPPVDPVYEKMDGEKLARIVQSELVKTLKTVDNGIIYRPNLAVLRRTKMPAVIAEIAYISNSSDRSRVSNAEFREKAANALANSVLKALKEMGANKNEAGQWML